MSNKLLGLLSRDWAGLVIAALVALLGVAAWACAVPVVHGLGAVTLVVGLLLAAGAIRHLVHVARMGRLHPAPGRMVDIGGYRLHVLAEGAAGDLPPIVWFGGSHGSGASMNYLHLALRETTRSILIDRPGAGWSDPGPFPRSTAREADEIVAALDAAGEKGPFIFVGYSFGGLLVANIARRRPDLVAKLVLFDATPLDTIVYGPRLGALKQMRDEMLRTAILRLFGYTGHLTLRRMEKMPAYAAMLARSIEVNGDAARNTQNVECGSKSDLASWSIFQELSPEGVAACGWETVVYDGDLGDMPLILVAPGNASEVNAEPEIANAAGGEHQRMIRFFGSTRERYMAASSNARRVHTPDGTTHQFVVETPEFVVDLMQRIVRD